MFFKHKDTSKTPQEVITDAVCKGAERGVLRAIAFFVVMIWVGLWFSGRDDSDTAYGERSGFTIYTDHLNGCQYLETRRGSITPRMNGTYHIGCGKKERHADPKT